MGKLALSLPGDEMDMPGMDSSKEESTEAEIKPGIHGLTLKKALDKGDGEAIEEAIRACMGACMGGS